MTRRGFTLLEVLVSTMIFSVVSLAMIGVFNSATTLFRGGESARAAADEATAALGMIDEDLKRLVPQADGGFLFTGVCRPDNDPNDAGNMGLAFKMLNPDAAAITATGGNARLIVVYWVDNAGNLNRATSTAPEPGPTNPTCLSVAKGLYRSNTVATRVAMGCLYFGVDLSTQLQQRVGTDWSGCLPSGRTGYCTESTNGAGNPSNADPFPDALRISLSITGGNRFSQAGTLIGIDPATNGFRVAGVKQVALTADAVARIGTPGPGQPSGAGNAEWVGYDRFARGVLTSAGGAPKRGLRRTDASTTHQRGEQVLFCPTFTLIRSFPH